MTLTTQDYRLTVTWADSSGRTATNVFAYKASDSSGSADDLVTAWSEQVATAVKNCLHSNFSISSVVCANLMDVTDYFDGTIAGVQGANAGEIMPLFVGLAFRIHRPDASVRHGRKTFGPIGEGQVNSGVISDAGSPSPHDYADALAAALDGSIGSAGGPSTTYALCIPKTVKVEPIGKNPYYAWDTLVPAQAVSFVRVSTQNSRKTW